VGEVIGVLLKCLKDVLLVMGLIKLSYSIKDKNMILLVVSMFYCILRFHLYIFLRRSGGVCLCFFHSI